MISILLLAASFQFIGVPAREPANSQQSIFMPTSSASPYVTTFPISQNSSDFTPFVLYPASRNTVWVVTIKESNIVNNVPQPPQAQIVNFTIGVKPHSVYNLTNAIPSDIFYDQKRNRVWFLENNSLAYYDATKGYTSIEHIFPAGSPQYMTNDTNGRIWITLLGSNQIVAYDPSGIASPQFFDAPAASASLQGIATAPDGTIWFAEHFAGRVAKYDPTTGSLTEYIVPATTIPYVWWMWPGPGNLVWFTAFGIGRIGYVNASLPVPISINAGVEHVKVEQGTSQAIPASISSAASGPIYLNVSANGHDAPFGSPPLLYGFAVPNQIVPTASAINATYRISAALTADLGERFVTLTAYNGNVAVNAFVTVNVTLTTIPFIFRTSAPYISVGFAFSIGQGSIGLFLVRPPKRLRKDQNREEDRTETTLVQSR